MSDLTRYQMLAAVVILQICFALSSTAQNTIRVPADIPTIQDAINVASNGDTVLVAPGTYMENINLGGKAVTLTSSGGASVTIIDGGHKASVVTFNSGEHTNSILNGFTIQNGTNSDFGGGISITSSSPTITNNVLQGNTAENGGAGIGINAGSPHIQGNTIKNNTQVFGYSGGVGGAGILIAGASSATIEGNLLTNNKWPSGSGGGADILGRRHAHHTQENNYRKYGQRLLR